MYRAIRGVAATWALVFPVVFLFMLACSRTVLQITYSMFLRAISLPFFRELSHVSGNRGDEVAAGFRYLFVN